jgi:hypothetical protein
MTSEPEMDGRILGPEEPAWGECLATCDHDIYHLPGFVHLEASRLGGEARLFVVREGAWSLALPLVVAPVAVGDVPVPGVFDARSPYGYPGPLVAGEPPVAWLGDAVRALLALLARASVAAVFVRLHTLLPTPREALAAAGRLVTHGETVWVDLTRSEAEIWSQTRGTTRNLVNRQRKAGLVVAMDDAWRHLDVFLDIYHQTMRQVGAADWYYFDRAYFHGLRAALGENLHLCTVGDGERVQAAALFGECSGTVQFHLAGTDPEFRAASPMRLMLDVVRRWAKARGNVRFHLGGGLGAARDSLFDFKAGFSPLRATFETWRAVVDQDAYGRAVSAWERRSGRASDPIEGYFPPWRRPFT